MNKKQLWTYISGGILNLFVLGSITSCGGMYQTSPNGDMKPKKSGTNEIIRHVACNGNTWVAGDDKGTLIVSTDNGQSWTKKNSGTTKSIRHVACNGAIWVAVGDEGTVLSSADAVQWQ